MRLLSVAWVRTLTDSGARHALDDVLDEFGIDLSEDDDENLTKAGNGWKEDTKDTAIELLKLIREDVED